MNRIIKLDSQFLCRNNLIDYSLLIKTEKIKSKTIRRELIIEQVSCRNKYLSADGNELYHLGIIDYL